MFFESVYLKNFLSYEDQTFDFIGPGLTLIEGQNLDEGGSNGAGKSSMWDATAWCLFGQTLRGLKADDVIRRKSKGGCRVEVCLNVSGKRYRVIRGRKDKHFGSRMVVKSGDDVIEKGTVVLTQDWLLEQLGIDFDLFKCTMMFAQGETFNFVNATNKQQKEILSKVMRLDFANLQTKAKQAIKKREEETAQLKQEITVLKANQMSAAEESYDQEIREWEERRQYEFNQVRETLKKKNEAAQKLWATKKDLNQINKLELKAEKKAKDAADIVAQLTRALAKLDGKLSIEQEALEKLKNLTGTCLVCHQAIDQNQIAEHRRLHIKNINAMISARDKVKTKLEKDEADLTNIQKLFNKLVQERYAQERDHKLLKQINEMIESLEERAKEVVGWENPWVKKKEELEKKQDAIKSKLEEKESEYEGTKEILAYYDFWVDAFGDAGIKSFLFDLVCATLTERANHYADTLTNGQVAIAFDTQTKTKSGEIREKFECSVITDGQKVKYEAYSGGEKRRISLAVDLALSDLMSDYYENDFNVVTFDEQDSYLDRQGRTAYLNLLKEKAKSKRVFVVAHDAEFKALFDDVWTVEKKGGVSCLI